MTTNHRLFFYCNFLLPKKEWLLALLLMLFSTYNLSAQQTNTISGKITSEKDGMPLPGVNIIIKGASTGTSTDFDGNYSITANPTDILVFSFIGYRNQEISISNRTKINFALIEDNNKLDEVVVIGYGSQKKADLTGSIGVVNMKEAKTITTYDPAKMLQGQVAGVTVQSSGEPGGYVNVKIRGISSFTNNNPLFVIDGMIVDSPNDFAPGDIESMQVLKDASSAAIYGVRGANGVVIITTKKGKQGKLEVKYKSLLGLQNVAKHWDVTDREGYQKITSAAEINAGLPVIPGNDPNSPQYINNVNTDWQKEAFQTGVINNQTLTFNGGAEALAYNMNVDYFKNTSYLNTPQDYKRVSTSVNLTGKKGKFKYGSKIAYTNSNKESFNSYVDESSVSALLTAIPTMPVYDANRLGGYGGTDNATQKAISLNVIGFNNLIDNTGERNRFVGDIWGEYEIVKGLKYKIDASYDRLEMQDRKFVPPSDLGWYYITTNDESALDVSNSNQTRTFLNNLLTYDVTLGKHKLDALVGWIQESNQFYRHWSRGVGYAPGTIEHIEYAASTSAGEYESTMTNISYLTRLNYSFDDRYFVTGNFRQDKTSLFAPENNTGNFYSFSGAWKISNEEFLHLPEWVNTIKVRGGYGVLGNNTIGVYAYSPTTNAFASYNFNNATAPGTTVVNAIDPNIHWENTATTNVALELGFLNNDLQFTAEYFVKKSTDLLVRVPLPNSSGTVPSDINTNAGAVRNNGLEFTASYGNNRNEFKYNISANLGTLKNKVEQIGIDGNPITGAASRTEVGRSIGELFAWETDGIFQNAAELAAGPTQTNAGVGDIRFKDVNGDGMISDLDRTYQGTTIPSYSYGMNFSASYKNFDFSMFWQGAGGNMVFNAMYRDLMLGQYVNHSTDELNYWTPTNTNTNVPRPIIGDPNGNSRDSNRFIEKGDYLKLQTLEIGYNIPVPQDIFIERAKVYVNGQNLLILSKYKGYDPDFNRNDGLLSRGYDSGSFPNPRTLSMGLEITF